jgi:hypothetical protein
VRRDLVSQGVPALTDSDLLGTGHTSMGTTGASALLQARTTTTCALQGRECDRVKKSTALAMKQRIAQRNPC